jgi:hypothetical protein
MRSATGLNARTAQGGEPGAHVALSAAVPFSLQNRMAFRIACCVLEERLAAALADRGAWAEVSDGLELFPDERLTLYIHCRPCPAESLPAGISPAGPQALLDAVHSVTRILSGTPLENAGIQAYKDLLVKQMEEKRNDPGALLGDVLTRYGEGKDLVTDYQAAIRSVDAAAVTRILGLLADGAQVEYMIL